MSQPERISLYLTEEHQCSYLPDKIAQTAFVDPKVIVSEPVYSSLNQQGFRRSGNYYYRPQCNQCQGCKSLRICVNEFAPNRSQRRCITKNSTLQAKINPEADIWNYYGLYSEYIAARHRDGDMYPPVPDQYESFLGNASNFVRYVEFFEGDNLVMVSVMDELADALSAIYTFYDPALENRGLGTYAILWQLKYARARRIPYLYLGFWIDSCVKMNYKSNFKPYQMLENGAWHKYS